MVENQKNLLSFFLGAILFSWICWTPGTIVWLSGASLPLGLLSLLKFIGACGPAFVALYLTFRIEGKSGLNRLLRSSFDIKRGGFLLLGACLVLGGLHFLSRLFYSLSQAELPESDFITSPLTAVIFFVVAFLVGGGLGEEIGWRGFALDLLQKKRSALLSSLILTGIWIIWHLPLFYYGGTNQAFIPFWAFILCVTPLGVLMTFVYNQTRTIFAAALFHTIGNLSHDLFRVMPTSASPGIRGYLYLAGLYAMAAIIIVFAYGPKTLCSKNKEEIND